jgi:predicted transposase/invertase (TIGR01784 family)
MEELRFRPKGDFIPFTSDYGFKITFGNERDTLFLRRALAALIESPHPITDVFFTKNTLDGLTKTSKSGIFDLSCIDAVGNTFIVEMQVEATLKFLNRLKFYGFQRYIALVKRGNAFDFGTIPKIYCIAIMGKKVYDMPEYHNVSTLKNQNGFEIDHQIKFITVELPKFKIKAKDIKTDLEKLIFTIKNGKKMIGFAKKPEFMNEEWIATAFHELETRSWTPEQYADYEIFKLKQFEEQQAIAKLEKRSEKRGEKRGEKNTSERFIREMLKQGLPIEQIAAISGLSVEDIKQFKGLRENNNSKE